MADHTLPSEAFDPALESLVAGAPPGESKSETSRATRVNRTTEFPHPIALTIFRPLRLAKLAFAVGLVVFLPYLLQRLPDLNSRPEYKLSLTDIQLVPSPESPVPANLLQQVRLQSHLTDDVLLLDPDLCEKLAAAFSKHPWIAQVISVEKSFPAAVTVRLEYRRPVAMAQVKGGRLPIDATGAILPSEDFSVSDVASYPTIRMAGSSSLVRKGGRFQDPGLAGAVQIAEILGPKWNAMGLEAIEVPRLREGTSKVDDIQFRLQTKVGSTVIWGRAPKTDHPGELTASQKIARLEKYLVEFGGFDKPSGPYEIDIRHWQEITRRPSGKVQASSRKDSKPR